MGFPEDLSEFQSHLQALQSKGLISQSIGAYPQGLVKTLYLHTLNQAEVTVKAVIPQVQPGPQYPIQKSAPS